MDNLKWRGWAKVVAYLDLILTGIVLSFAVTAWVLVSAAVFGVFITHPETGEPYIREADYEVSLRTVWLSLVLAHLLLAIQLWAAIKLIGATQSGRSAAEALKMSAIWRNIAIILLVIYILSFIDSRNYIMVVNVLVIKGSFLYIVFNFMLELKRVLNPIPNPSFVTVKL